MGELPIAIPRDRHVSFKPQIITKHQTRWAGFEEKILLLYARGMTVRGIQSHLQEMYGAEVLPTLISSLTDAKAVFLPLGVSMEGEKDILAWWIAQTQGAKFWLHVVLSSPSQLQQEMDDAPAGLEGSTDSI